MPLVTLAVDQEHRVARWLRQLHAQAPEGLTTSWEFAQRLSPQPSAAVFLHVKASRPPMHFAIVVDHVLGRPLLDAIAGTNALCLAVAGRDSRLERESSLALHVETDSLVSILERQSG